MLNCLQIAEASLGQLYNMKIIFSFLGYSQTHQISSQYYAYDTEAFIRKYLPFQAGS